MALSIALVCLLTGCAASGVSPARTLDSGEVLVSAGAVAPGDGVLPNVVGQANLGLWERGDVGLRLAGPLGAFGGDTLAGEAGAEVRGYLAADNILSAGVSYKRSDQGNSLVDVGSSEAVAWATGDDLHEFISPHLRLVSLPGSESGYYAGAELRHTLSRRVTDAGRDWAPSYALYLVQGFYDEDNVSRATQFEVVLGLIGIFPPTRGGDFAVGGASFDVKWPAVGSQLGFVWIARPPHDLW